MNLRPCWGKGLVIIGQQIDSYGFGTQGCNLNEKTGVAKSTFIFSMYLMVMDTRNP